MFLYPVSSRLPSGSSNEVCEIKLQGKYSSLISRGLLLTCEKQAFIVQDPWASGTRFPESNTEMNVVLQLMGLGLPRFFSLPLLADPFQQNVPEEPDVWRKINVWSNIESKVSRNKYSGTRSSASTSSRPGAWTFPTYSAASKRDCMILLRDEQDTIVLQLVLSKRANCASIVFRGEATRIYNYISPGLTV